MKRTILSMAGGALLLAASASAPMAADVEVVVPEPDWSCTCVAYKGNADACTVTVSITGSVLTHGVGDIWGEGTYVARHLPLRTIVNGVVTTAEGEELPITVVDWKGDHVDRGWLHPARLGIRDFTAQCTGTVP